jgi:flagellum-specific peptidoglycan hydrolase FlgJ
MGENRVDDKLTAVSPADLYAALRADWPQVSQDTLVTRSALLVLLAQWAFETGWGHYCHNWNLGNAKHVAGDGHDYCMFHCTEVIGGKVVPFDPPNPACAFIAFASLEEATNYYLVSLRGRWRSAWQYALAGDAAGFCHQLKLQGYYTDDERHYTLSVQSCMHVLDAMIPPDPDPASFAAGALALAANSRELPAIEPPDAA